MRLRPLAAFAVFLSVCIAAGGCASRQTPPRPLKGVFWDQGVFAVSDHRGRLWRKAGVSDVFVTVGAVRTSQSGAPSLDVLAWGDVPKGLPVMLNLRLEGAGLDDALYRDPAGIARRLSSLLDQQWDSAMRAGVRPRGFMVDVPVPVRSPSSLAGCMRRVRRDARGGAEVWLCVPAPLVYSSGVRQLAGCADFIVLRTFWEQPVRTVAEACACGLEPEQVSRWVSAARRARLRFGVLIDPRARLYPLNSQGKVSGPGVVGAGGAAGWLPREADRVAAGVRGEDRMLYGAPGRNPSAFVRAPHARGLRALAACLPRPGHDGYLGWVIAVNPAATPDLGMGDTDMQAALEGRVCSPAPVLHVQRMKDRNRLAFVVTNHGGAAALAPDSIRLRLDCPPGAVVSVQQGQFRTVQCLRQREGDCYVLSAERLSGRSIRTGEVRVNGRKGLRLRVAAVLAAPGGGAGGACSRAIGGF